MTNLLEAIYNIIHQIGHNIQNEDVEIKNRANNMGEALEKYLKDAFCNGFDIKTESERIKLYSESFSWLGNQNNPPDFIIKEGDAVEVKKIESLKSDLALNSSYPKHKLLANSPMITKDCRDCEVWNEKDIIYCIGHVKNEKLNSLWMVYGSLYAANQEIYERIKTTISSGLTRITDVEFAETKELGRVNRVDPLGITNLRIRGMWSIQNPEKVFDYLESNSNSTFKLNCIIPLDKYNSFVSNSISKIENVKLSNFSIKDIQVKNPNNPANLIDAKLIQYYL